MADILKAGQLLVLGRVIEHGHSSQLHDTVWSQIDGLKRAEVHQGHLIEGIVGITVPSLLGACGTQGTVEKELRMHIPHEAVPLQVKISLYVE
jgi:hypothetical protein